MKNHIIDLDKKRYLPGRMPLFQKYYRKCQNTRNPIISIINKVIYKILCGFRHIELSSNTEIGAGLYLGHAYGITINPKVIIGKNANIHKGVTIGQENRGLRKGVPTIGDCVWIGVNATIVGNVTIGNDVLVAPNCFVNCDVPDHSVVFGNPCIIKRVDKATIDYIDGTV